MVIGSAYLFEQTYLNYKVSDDTILFNDNMNYLTMKSLLFSWGIGRRTASNSKNLRIYIVYEMYVLSNNIFFCIGK